MQVPPDVTLVVNNTSESSPLSVTSCHHDVTCIIFRDTESLQVTGVQRAATEEDGAAHHCRQSHDGEQDGPPMGLQKRNKNYLIGIIDW